MTTITYVLKNGIRKSKRIPLNELEEKLKKLKASKKVERYFFG